MPETMVDIFDKGSSLGNVFNKAVSSADGVNSGRAGEGAESDGTQKSVPFQEILGQQMTKNSPCSACPPQKSGKPVVEPGVVGSQEEALMLPLVTGDKQQATKLKVGKEGIKGAKQQKDAEINYSVINEHLLNGIFSANIPLQPATGFSSNPQIIEGESGLQMGNTLIGNGTNIASTLFTNAKETPGDIGVGQGNAFPMIDNQALSATAGNKDFQGVPIGEIGVNLEELGFEISKGAGDLQMTDKLALNDISQSLSIGNRQPSLSVSQTAKEENFVGDFHQEPGILDSTVFEVSAQTTPSLTADTQPTKELPLSNDTDPQQGLHFSAEKGASTAASSLQQDGEQGAFEDSREEPSIFDFASIGTSEKKTPGDLLVTANTQPGKEPRRQNYLELQQNASISPGNNATQSFSSEGVTSYLHHDKTATAGQTPSDIMDQLFQRISLATHGDRSEIKLELTPPELGKIKIHFVEENNEVKAKIFVENAEVKATIENNVHHLRESIASSGVGVHKLEVYLQNEETNKQKSLEDFSANNFGRQNQGQRHTGQGKNYSGEGKTDDSVVNTESGANASHFIIDYIS
ncbi:MAG: flagellar hook-length control protein FliK [Planctomycetota bacterium]